MAREALIREMWEIVGARYLLLEKEDVIVYEQDGSILQAMPEIVVLPADVDQVSAVVPLARRENLPIVPRGSGIGLAGGAVPAEGGIVLSLSPESHFQGSICKIASLSSSLASSIWT